jgi:uncharacterized membrane protein YgcG
MSFLAVFVIVLAVIGLFFLIRAYRRQSKEDSTLNEAFTRIPSASKALKNTSLKESVRYGQSQPLRAYDRGFTHHTPQEVSFNREGVHQAEIDQTVSNFTKAINTPARPSYCDLYPINTYSDSSSSNDSSSSSSSCDSSSSSSCDSSSSSCDGGGGGGGD